MGLLIHALVGTPAGAVPAGLATSVVTLSAPYDTVTGAVEKVTVALALGERVRVALPVGESVGVPLAVGERVGVALALGEREGVKDALAEGEGVTVALGEVVSVAAGDALAVREALCETDADVEIKEAFAETARMALLAPSATQKLRSPSVAMCAGLKKDALEPSPSANPYPGCALAVGKEVPPATARPPAKVIVAPVDTATTRTRQFWNSATTTFPRPSYTPPHGCHKVAAAPLPASAWPKVPELNLFVHAPLPAEGVVAAPARIETVAVATLIVRSRLLQMSATKRRPAPSEMTPSGQLNMAALPTPSAKPLVFAAPPPPARRVTTRVVRLIWRIRPLYSSATKSNPDSAAQPTGPQKVAAEPVPSA